MQNIIYRETQKKAKEGKIVDYPIQSIEKKTEIEIEIICRDAEKIGEIIEILPKFLMALRRDGGVPGYKYHFSEDKDALSFTVTEDINEAISDFIHLGFASTNLRSLLSASNQAEPSV